MNKTTKALLDKLCELQHELTLAKQTATQQGEFATMWRDKCYELQREQNLSTDFSPDFSPNLSETAKSIKVLNLNTFTPNSPNSNTPNGANDES